jgi:hypothetical protein
MEQAESRGQYQYQEQEKTQKNEMPRSGVSKTQFSFSFEEEDTLDQELRKPRSRAYMEIFDVIDMLSATDEEIIEQLTANMDEDTAEEFAEMTMEEILEEIKACFQEEFENMPIKIESVLNGVLAKCYIDGCDCHAITVEGKILDHYKKNVPLPEELEKGRIVFNRFPDCKCVEVYTDCCRVIADDASVLKIPNYEIF